MLYIKAFRILSLALFPYMVPTSSGGPLVWRAKFPNLHSYLIGIISKANAIGAGDCQPPIVPTVITLVLNQQIINWLWSHAGNELQLCLP